MGDRTHRLDVSGTIDATDRESLDRGREAVRDLIGRVPLHPEPVVYTIESYGYEASVRISTSIDTPKRGTDG